MYDPNRLGKNIKAFRKVFGETQQQLGDVIGVVKNTVSSYEKGDRVPDHSILESIAEHYVLPVDELLQGDYSKLLNYGPIKIDTTWRNIEQLFPIVTSEEAEKNENFLRAYAAHKELYKWFMDNNYGEDAGVIENMDGYISCYIDTLADDDTILEPAVNILALWHIFMLIFKTMPMIIETQPATIRQISVNDKEVQQYYENKDPSCISDMRAILRDAEEYGFDNELKQTLLSKLKKRKRWSDLADYYLALQYVLNLVDNDLSFGLNQWIGFEMMKAFASLGNKYTKKFLEFDWLFFPDQSSQNVD